MPTDTKQVIAQAFSELAEERGIDRVSVTALIERCGVSRQTFYYHFRDLDDLMAWIAGRRLDQLLAQCEGSADPQRAFRLLIDEVIGNRSIFQRVLISARRSQLEAILAGELRGYLEKLARTQPQTGAVDLDLFETSLSLYAHGIAGVLMERCLDDQVDAELLSHQLAQAVVNGIQATRMEHRP